MNVHRNDRIVIRYVYGRPGCNKSLTKVNSVHILSMISTRRWVYFFSVAAVVSLHSTAVSFRYQYQYDIDFEFVFRTDSRTHVSKPMNICISVLQLNSERTIRSACTFIDLFNNTANS